jgi:Protein of unknown function (DUF3307)
VAWVEIFAVFVVSHALGDYLLQTDWQATHKRGGLGGDHTARLALLTHVSVYTLSFVPALVWLTDDGLNVGGAILVALGIFLPHMVQDDGRLLSRYIRSVKGCDEESEREIFTAVDQSFHLITLFATALIVHGAS